MIKPVSILVLIVFFSSFAKATSFVKAPPGAESRPLPKREITYKGYEVSLGKYGNGNENEYIEALDCISESIASGDFYGKRWNNLYRRYSFVKVPKDIKITHISDVGAFKTYSATLGENEFVYTIEINIKGGCTITNDEFI
jgi:hypothetical protein